MDSASNTRASMIRNAAGMKATVFRSAIILAAVSAAITLFLGGLLLRHNHGPFGFLGVLDLFFVVAVMVTVVNVGFTTALIALWPALRRLGPRWLADAWPTYLAAGLLALNLVWALWNRLGMVHQWASVRPFITWTGLIQSVLLALLFFTLLLAAVAWNRGTSRAWIRAGLPLIALSIVLGTLAWNRHDEQLHRRYSMDAVRQAAIASLPDSPDVTATEDGPLILLGIDGLCWSVLTPLMQAGHLPAIAGLVDRGSIGYLDNRDESLSPSIWTTIFTGRPVDEHGVQDYQKLMLPGSDVGFPDLLMMKPSMDTMYGLRYLTTYLGRLGLWRLDFMGSADWRVPAIWEIVSFYEKRVVVANAIVNQPVRPVNGANVYLKRRPSLQPLTVFPPELADDWQVEIPADQSGSTDASFEDMVRLMHDEVTFTIELFERYGADLGIFYSHFSDSVSHTNWDFHSRDRFFVTNLPRDLDDRQWAELVVQNEQDRVFRAYIETDKQIARFIEAYPGATIFLVSDHGWTYSGYEHFGSQDGVVIAAGPRIRAGGTLDTATIDDITPTLLAFLNVPLSREFDGKVLQSAFERHVLTTYVDRYALSALKGDGEGAESLQLNAEEIERLRSLGYIQ